MSRTTDSSDPFPRTSRDWRAMLVRWAKAAMVAAGSAIIALVGYAANTYMRDIARSEAITQSSAFSDLPPKVQTLMEFKGRTEEAHKETVGHLEQMNAALVRIETVGDARWSAQIEQNRRVLEVLDRMERRLQRSSSTAPGGSQP